MSKPSFARLTDCAPDVQKTALVRDDHSASAAPEFKVDDGAMSIPFLAFGMCGCKDVLDHLLHLRVRVWRGSREAVREREVVRPDEHAICM